MNKLIIGIMGPGEGATEADLSTAEKLGALIAKEGWILLTGGRDSGVMNAAAKGADNAGGLTVGILPGSDKTAVSEYIRVPVVTGMGSARNNINILTSDVVVVCGTGLGTFSELVLAAKAGKTVIALNQTGKSEAFIRELVDSGFHFAGTPGEAVEIIKSDRT